MHRIDTDGTVSSLPTPGPAGSLVGYFSDGEAISGTPGTVIGANWLNAVQEEIVAVLSEGGLSPDKSTNDQLKDAIIAIIEERSIDSAISGVSNKLLRTDGSARTPVVSTSVELDASDNLGSVSSLAIGSSIAGKNGSAALEVNSTSKGFLPPRMTESQRNAIASPEAGLVVYNSTQKRHDFHNGLTWGAMSGAAVPVGGIIAFSGGYFTDASNGGFTNVLGNSVAAINSALNGSGWYVCDGSALNLPGSPIFNGAGRYLPNLSNSRFLMGSTSAGTTGGSTTNTAQFSSGTIATSGGAATFNKNVFNNDQVAHSHSYGSYAARFSIDSGSGRQWVRRYTSTSLASEYANDTGNTYSANTDSKSQGLELSGTSATSEATWSSATVTTTFTQPSFNATLLNTRFIAQENRPLYLSVVYIKRVI